MGVSGQPFIGADIPGFCSTPTPELAARWIQCGALTPFCRYHNHSGEPDQYPWSFGPDVERLCRAALELRYRLLPYIYSAFVHASETGDPIQRPLAYDFPRDSRAHSIDDAYLFGDALLVAPISEPGCTERQVYLPEGTWVDFYTGERHRGGQVVAAAAPADRIPLFGRGGYAVPTDESAYLSTMDHYPERLVLHVFVPDEDGIQYSQLHEDDGLTLAYQDGAYLRTTFCVTRRARSLSVVASVVGKGFAEFRRRALRLVFHGFDGVGITFNGRSLAVVDGAVDIDNRGESFALTLAL
jgi:alpha-glucosidase